MNSQDINELRQLIDAVIYTSSKKEAQGPIRRLEFKAAGLMQDIEDPYFRGKLREAIDYAKEASGQPRDKERWISNMESSWYVFNNGVEDTSKEHAGEH